MEVQEFFYWVASITLILIALFMISLFALLFYIKNKAEKIATEIAMASKAWRNLSFARILLRTIKFFF